MAREFELKYQATPQKIRAIREKYGSFTPITMETTYYDTPDRDFGRRHWTLRRRLENGISVCTLKTPLPDGSRGEWETCCDQITESISELCKLGAPEALADLAKKGLAPSCGAAFTRLAAKLELDGCAVELALDEGFLLGGGKKLPLAEVEVELKAGSEILAVAFAKALSREFDLTPEPKSKIQRALALADAG